MNILLKLVHVNVIFVVLVLKLIQHKLDVHYVLLVLIQMMKVLVKIVHQINILQMLVQQNVFLVDVVLK